LASVVPSSGKYRLHTELHNAKQIAADQFVGLPYLRKVSRTRGGVIYKKQVLGGKEQVCLEPGETLELRMCFSGKL